MIYLSTRRLFFLLIFVLLGWSDLTYSQRQGSEEEVWPTKSWNRVTPETVGMNSLALKEAEKIYPEIFPSSYSLLIIRKGKIVSESYFRGQNFNSSNHVYSITKTIIASLIAIAIKQGWISGVEQKICKLLPEYKLNPENVELTIEDVMTHRSGLPFSKDFKNILNQVPKSPPGTVFEYSNQAPSLLAAILDRIVKQNKDSSIQDVQSFARKYLFEPLGIHINRWELGPNGIPDGANGIYMTARDMARIGFLLLEKGWWENKQLLPNGWVESESRLRVEVDRQKGYGYLTWVRRRPDLVKTAQGEQFVHGFFAYGHRGQYIGIYPELELLVVASADATDSSRDTYFVPDLIHDFVRRFIFSSFNYPSNLQ